MAYEPTLSFHEIFTKVNNAKDKPKKIEVLKRYDTKELRMILKAAFDPNIKWKIPEGDVPYEENDAPTGTEHTWLKQESHRLYHFIEGGNNEIKQFQREKMFVQMLEGLHRDEANLLVAAKDKLLHKTYKGLSSAVVKEAFNWDDDYQAFNPMKERMNLEQET